MSDQEIINERILSLEESVNFYSPQNKLEREKWVAERFLQNIGIEYIDSEIEMQNMDPPDFIFRNSKFEIKEILDSGRKRHDEYRTELERIKNLNHANDIYKTAIPIDKTVNEIAEICFFEAEKINSKYKLETKSQINLLFYVNLKHVYIDTESKLENTDRFSCFGWQSISFVTGSKCCVIYSAKTAPEFISSITGSLLMRENS
jgi:hypothetical protein